MIEDANDLKNEAPAGSESRVLFPETRSGVGSKTTKSNGAETPFPDQATGERPQRSDLAAYSEWFQSDEADASLARLKQLVGMEDWPEVAKVFIAGRLSQRREPRAQSGAHGDEPEAALRDAIEVANFEAAEWEQAVREFKEAGFTKRERSEYAHKAASLRYAARALATLLPQESRKERSVSGNSELSQRGTQITP